MEQKVRGTIVMAYHDLKRNQFVYVIGRERPHLLTKDQSAT